MNWRDLERQRTAITQKLHDEHWEKIQKLPRANAKEKAIAREAKRKGTRNREMWS